jgi:pyridoxal phosphate enzyme (YggS family)
MPVQIDFYHQLQKELSEKKITLVAVSKTKPVSDILELYNAGQRDFGENYVQELEEKYRVLPKDIRWHFIGHLQTNKVKQIIPYVHLIHGVDSPKLLREVNKQAAKINRVASVLLQVHIAEEETKFGMAESELVQLLDELTQAPLPNVLLSGLMGMASFTHNQSQIRKEFHELKRIFNLVSKRIEGSSFQVLSMGMSSDYIIAIEEGANLVRIGSSLFGSRS